jgi:hypothetical protein
MRAGLDGCWRPLQRGQRQYRTLNGAILNWCQRTGKITFQGDDATARNELKQAFIASSKKRLFGRCDGRSFYGTLNSLYRDECPVTPSKSDH